MCGPVPLILAAAALKAGGSIMSGNAQGAADEAQAAQVDLQTRQRARSIRYMAKQTISSARADYAASGVDVNSGSPELAQKTISYNSEVDTLNAIASGEAAAASLRRSGRAARNAGLINAAGSILGAFGNASAARGVSAGTVAPGSYNPAASPNWVGPRG